MMKAPDKSKTKLDAAVPKSDAMENLSESEKKALEAGGEAEHETGQKRENLQRKAGRE